MSSKTDTMRVVLAVFFATSGYFTLFTKWHIAGINCVLFGGFLLLAAVIEEAADKLVKAINKE